jgi:hypothetical protein
VTVDNKWNKDTLRELVKRRRDEASIRKRSRRIRKQLEEIQLGDRVHGVVEGVVPEGVLVSITSLGALNVTGIIPLKRLPSQFQLPKGLDDKSKEEILRMDFMPGRFISAGVLKIDELSAEGRRSCLVLALEHLGPAIESSDGDNEMNLSPLSASGEENEDLDDIFNESDDEEHEEEEEELGERGEEDVINNREKNDHVNTRRSQEGDAELKLVFKDLCRGGSELLLVNLMKWRELKKLQKTGILTTEFVDKTVKEIGVTGISMDFQQFKDFSERVAQLSFKHDGKQSSELSPEGSAAEEWDNTSDEEYDDYSEEQQIIGTTRQEDDIDDQELVEEYNFLKKTHGKVTASSVLDAQGIDVMLKDNWVTRNEIFQIISELIHQSVQEADLNDIELDVSQFIEIVRKIDEKVGEKTSHLETSYKRQLFDGLKAKGEESVPVQAFINEFV